MHQALEICPGSAGECRVVPIHERMDLGFEHPATLVIHLGHYNLPSFSSNLGGR